MDFAVELFNLFVFLSFLFICTLFLLIVKKPLAIIPSFFFGVAIYTLTYNGLFAGLSLFLLALILQSR